MGLSTWRVWRKLRTHRWFQYALIATANAVAQPLDYRRPSRRLHARVPGMWKMPLVAAGCYAHASSRLMDWVFWQRAHPEAQATDVFTSWQHIHWSVALGSLLLVSTVAYALAGCRWIFHCVCRAIVQYFGVAAQRIPLKYFLMSSAFGAFWFGIFAEGFAWLCWATSGIHRADVQRWASNHPLVIVAAAALVYGAACHCANVQREGIRAVYGGSKRVVWAMDLALAVSASLILVLLSRAHASA